MLIFEQNKKILPFEEAMKIQAANKHLNLTKICEDEIARNTMMNAYEKPTEDSNSTTSSNISSNSNEIFLSLRFSFYSYSLLVFIVFVISNRQEKKEKFLFKNLVVVVQIPMKTLPFFSKFEFTNNSNQEFPKKLKFSYNFS